MSVTCLKLNVLLFWPISWTEESFRDALKYISPLRPTSCTSPSLATHHLNLQATYVPRFLGKFCTALPCRYVLHAEDPPHYTGNDASRSRNAPVWNMKIGPELSD